MTEDERSRAQTEIPINCLYMKFGLHNIVTESSLILIWSISQDFIIHILMHTLLRFSKVTSDALFKLCSFMDRDILKSKGVNSRSAVIWNFYDFFVKMAFDHVCSPYVF